MNPNSTHEDKKITLHILIEGGRSFTEEFVVKQKVEVIVNKTLAHFHLNDSEKRQLMRGDNSILTDYSKTLEELGLRNEESLRFLLKAAPKPEEPKKFA